MSAVQSITPVRVGTYVRMSDDDQESSPERQRSLVLPYCNRKSYVVVGEYVDLGIAGDEFEKRTDFQRLLRDAAAGLLDVVVSDEPSRVSRLDPIDFFALVARPLRAAGVTLDTVSGGPLGWDELPPQLMHLLNADKAHAEPKALARRVLSGMALWGAGGHPVGGVAPYGYKVEYVQTSAPGKAPRMRPVRLVPDGDKAAAVRWMFRRYDGADVSLQDVADELTRQGIPPPGRKAMRKHTPRWTRTAVRVILTNPRYTGAAVWNRYTDAKHYRLAGGQPVKHDRGAHAGRGGGKGKRTKHANGREEWVVVPDQHDGLVEQEMFDRVQAKLSSQQNGRKTVASGGHLLSGLLVCGHCGRVLHAQTMRGSLMYRCRKSDDTDRGQCGYGGVKEGPIVAVVLAKLRERFTGAGEAAIRAELARQMRADSDPAEAEGLRRRLDELAGWIDQGNTNLTILPPDRHAGVIAKLRGFEQEQAALTKRLKDALDRRPTEAAINAELEEIKAVVSDIQSARDEGDRPALREAITRLVSRVSVRWERRLINRYTRHELAGGIIGIRPDRNVAAFTTVTRGCH
jgi:DNA invertase Pin-like site-specific DNA recombinase